MNQMKWRSAVLVTAGLIAFGVSEAGAQPTVTWQQTGSVITVQWTTEPGATQYDVVVTGTVNYSGTLPTNFVQVVAPTGTYVLQVRGRAGAAVGPFSAPTTIVVTGGTQPGPCLPLSAPTINASASGQVASISWGAVAGAIGYRLQVGIAPGTSQFSVDLPANQFSYSAPVPVVGTFYTRVLAANACSQIMSSPEATFTVGAPTPGPTPPPAPGGPLPFPIPAACSGVGTNGLPCAQAIAALSNEWGLCRAGSGVGCNRFTRQVIYALSRSDPNWKSIRAAPGGHACSCSSCGPSDGSMFREDTTVYGGNRVFDMIIGAGGPSPALWWNEVPGPRAGDIPTDAPVCQ